MAKTPKKNKALEATKDWFGRRAEESYTFYDASKRTVNWDKDKSSLIGNLLRGKNLRNLKNVAHILDSTFRSIGVSKKTRQVPGLPRKVDEVQVPVQLLRDEEGDFTIAARRADSFMGLSIENAALIALQSKKEYQKTIDAALSKNGRFNVPDYLFTLLNRERVSKLLSELKPGYMKFIQKYKDEQFDDKYEPLDSSSPAHLRLLDLVTRLIRFPKHISEEELKEFEEPLSELGKLVKRYDGIPPTQKACERLAESMSKVITDFAPPVDEKTEKGMSMPNLGEAPEPEEELPEDYNKHVSGEEAGEAIPTPHEDHQNSPEDNWNEPEEREEDASNPQISESDSSDSDSGSSDTSDDDDADGSKDAGTPNPDESTSNDTTGSTTSAMGDSSPGTSTDEEDLNDADDDDDSDADSDDLDGFDDDDSDDHGDSDDDSDDDEFGSNSSTQDDDDDSDDEDEGDSITGTLGGSSGSGSSDSSSSSDPTSGGSASAGSDSDDDDDSDDDNFSGSGSVDDDDSDDEEDDESDEFSFGGADERDNDSEDETSSASKSSVARSNDDSDSSNDEDNENGEANSDDDDLDDELEDDSYGEDDDDDQDEESSDSLSELGDSRPSGTDKRDAGQRAKQSESENESDSNEEETPPTPNEQRKRDLTNRAKELADQLFEDLDESELSTEEQHEMQDALQDLKPSDLKPQASEDLFNHAMDQVGVSSDDPVVVTWNIEKADDATYNKVKSQLNMVQAGVLRKLFTSKHKDQQMSIRGMKSGRLDVNKIAEAVQGVKTVYERMGTVTSNKICVGVLIDESGSMSGGLDYTTYYNNINAGMNPVEAHEIYADSNKIGKARQAAIFLNECFSKVPDVQFFVYGHSADQKVNYRNMGVMGKEGSCEMYVYREPGARTPSTALGSVRSRSNNRDGKAILLAAMRIRKFTQDPGILVVISDGQPAGSGYMGKAAIADTRQKVSEVERMGFTVIQVAIEAAVPSEEMFQHFVKMTDIKSLPTDLVNFMTRQMSKLIKTRYNS